MTTGNRIRQARQARDLTQEQFAQKVGVTLVTVSRWERDKNRPFPRQLPAIAAALGTSVESLVEDEVPARLRTADPFASAFLALLRGAVSEEVAVIRRELGSARHDRRRSRVPISVDRRSCDRRVVSA